MLSDDGQLQSDSRKSVHFFNTCNNVIFFESVLLGKMITTVYFKSVLLSIKLYFIINIILN